MTDQSYGLDDLLHLMSRLRDPEHGCPWDIKQTFDSIVPYTLEEAYEVADAIEQKDFAHLKEELGDLLFQVIFYSQLGKEQEYFEFSEVVHTLVSKLVRRHPHVFPTGKLHEPLSTIEPLSAEQVKARWDEIKQEERAEKAQKQSARQASILDDIPATLPAINRAEKLQKRAATVGFDWPEATPVLDKIEEEIQELREAIAHGEQEDIQDEMGDLMFACVNLARHLKVKPEMALRSTNQKFDRRFRYVEKETLEKYSFLEEATLEEMEQLWQQAKLTEK